MADLTAINHTEPAHKRRAADRAEERVDRAADRGDHAALRIAGAQLDALLRQRAAYRRPSQGASRERGGH